jgi:hypothetical protein
MLKCMVWGLEPYVGSRSYGDEGLVLNVRSLGHDDLAAYNFGQGCALHDK